MFRRAREAEGQRSFREIEEGRGDVFAIGRREDTRGYLLPRERDVTLIGPKRTNFN